LVIIIFNRVFGVRKKVGVMMKVASSFRKESRKKERVGWKEKGR